MRRANFLQYWFAIALLLPTCLVAQENESPTRNEAKYDKLQIRHKAEMTRDQCPEFLKIPADYPDVQDFDAAKEAPLVDFAIIQGLEPWDVPPSGPRTGKPVWGGWGDVSRGPDGCYYFSVGNHMYIGAQGYLIKYDPARKKQQILFDVASVFKWGSDDFGDSKLHGDLDIGPDGTMWILTFFGPYFSREHQERDNYRGSYLMRYNINTGKVENLGIPVGGATWPYHNYDWQRGLLFGVEHARNMVMAYDTAAGKILYAGAPPLGINWYNRGLLLDRDTGIFYSSDTGRGEEGQSKEVQGTFHLVSWERKNNRFRILNSMMPANPVTGKRGGLRAATEEKDQNGAFWCFDNNGTAFKFFPKEDRVELVGVNWGKEGKYIANMSWSPGKRYLYYVADAGTNAYAYGTPVIQYDTRTNRKKVLAFLNDFYLEKYGYSPGGTYGVEVDDKGESLVFYMNGRFTSKALGPRYSGYGRPSLFHLHIPASERIE